MKKTTITIIAIVLIIGAYFVFRTDEPKSESVTTYSDATTGIAFDYRTGPTGYIVDERMPVDLGTGLIKNIILSSAEDAQQEVPVGGEMPPTMTISVFENTKKQFPQTWADEHIQESNINLKQGPVSEAVVGGANAIRYMTDGLYASETFVVAHGENMYVINGAFIDEASALRKDFAPLVASIRFIPQPGQE